MASSKFHWPRRATQLATLALFVLIPALGLFRIDLVAGTFMVLGRQVGWGDISLMLGFATVLIMLAVVSYASVGAVWCGWACPQNFVSEWANNLTYKLLGKRASVSVESRDAQVAASKNNVLNWIVLVGAFLAASLVLGVIPFFYFFSPEEVWSLVIVGNDARLSKFMHSLYFVSVVAFFLDVSGIRYFWCDYACAYRFGQRFFKTQDALHIAYDKSRSADCEKCNYCAATCIISINPSNFKSTDTCINCGECVDACDRLHEKDGTQGLLRFSLAEAKPGSTVQENKKRGLFQRVSMWVWLILFAGCAMTGWGMYNYSPYNIVAYRSEKSAGDTVSDYKIQISNKLYSASQLSLSIKGLPEGSYKLATEKVELAPASRADVNLHISPDLSRGLHRIIIEAHSSDGWEGRFGVEHYSAGN